ncbi:protein-L-isoaspartate(D-aspartate) O-methyltransferase [Amycolatopsis saalfeldensis]|uniref:Protein-L-isoaspartate O-methyltransferase n=2 Tax=Amycolatopsis saalfeldensis TaxID=394193 RepID=A0A1H8YNU8_9PSEU|nr:protein-L-isoaspartate(D-aspartate) O-methyltransferase [Amycolatopsis saalfeldensis]
MVAGIKDAGYPLSRDVEQALLAVERHAFVPGASLAEAYAAAIVVTKRGPGGEVLSCLSAPSIVALQLQQLDVRPGHRVLEIGAGTGYNAALLGHLVGPGGHVTTIDVDADIVDDARRRLAAARVGNVEVVLGDGALGSQGGAQFDRIVATVGAYDIPQSWLSQLAPGGRLVVPLRIRGSITRSIAFERDEAGGWRSADHQLCGFVPLRDGAADDPRRTISLTADETVTLQLHQEHDGNTAWLAEIFDQPRTAAWTGVTFGPMESVEWLYLWLACTEPGGLCRMATAATAVESGQVAPMFNWGAMAVAADDALAYLTWRAAEGARDRRELAEVGIIGHGPGASTLVDQINERISLWEKHFRQSTVTIEIPADRAGSSDPAEGQFFLDRTHNPVAVRWVEA